MTLLSKGDTVAFIAPSCDKTRQELVPAIEFFQSLELKTVISDEVGNVSGYSPEFIGLRANQINKLFADNTIKALVCVRGGAGASELLPLINYNLIAKNPKPIIGLSDSTALQTAAYTLGKGNISLTGYLACYKPEDNNSHSYTASRLRSALFDSHKEIISGQCFNKGFAKAPIIGGNLSVFASLCGTPYFPNLAGKILLLEEVGEKSYKINRLLLQIRQQKGFAKLKGIILGQYTDCPHHSVEDPSLSQSLENFVRGLDIPIVQNFNYGHIANRDIIPLGQTVELETTPKQCRIIWA